MLATSRALSGIFMWHARFDITCVPLVTDVNHVAWSCNFCFNKLGMDIPTKKHTAFVSGEEKHINGSHACTCLYCTCGKQDFSTEEMETNWHRDCCNHQVQEWVVLFQQSNVSVIMYLFILDMVQILVFIQPVFVSRITGVQIAPKGSLITWQLTAG